MKIKIFDKNCDGKLILKPRILVMVTIRSELAHGHENDLGA
jgi:hypothetical protein